MALALPKHAMSNEEIFPDNTYQDITLLLDKEDKILSYNDLVNIFQTISASDDHIPGMEEILLRLLQERNEHPRVDQMILIVTAKLVGSSKQEITNVTRIIESLTLNKRANMWTIGFVGEALGDYFIDLKNGDHLADMIEKKVESLIEKQKSSTDEYYGFHFLPPPTTEYIKNIISHPKEQKRREATRNNYYLLRMQNSEEQIKAYLLFLDRHGEIDTRRKIDFSMKYLLINIESIKAAISKEQQDKLSS